MKKLYIGSIAFISVLFLLYFFSKSHQENQASSSLQQQAAATGADRPFEAIAFEIQKTNDPATGEVPRERLNEARQMQRKYFEEQLRTGRQSNISGLTWTERGPDNVAGRTRAIMFDANDPTTKKVWAAGVGGGLWYTNDITAATTIWNKISDTLNNLAITCITQGKSFQNRNKLFFGTGEGWGNGDAIRGNGIWRSLDGGATWTQLSSTKNSDSFRYVQDILFVENGGGPCLFSGPALLAATKAGIFRSTNDGTSWTKVLGAGLGGASINAAADLESAYYYTFATLGMSGIGGGGIYRSCDAGQTWEEIYDAPGTEERIEIATHYLDGWEMYAVVQGNNSKALKIMKSSNADAVPANLVSFPVKNLPPICGLSAGATEFTNSQASYDLIIEVAPFFRNPPANDHHFTAYVGGIDLHKTTNSGTGWTQLCEWKNVATCGKPYVHADKHNLIFRPNGDPNFPGYFPSDFLVTSDGGIHRSTDGGTTFSSRNKSFNVTQFYSCAFYPAANTDYFLAGSQDNNTQKFTTPGMNSTTNIITQDSDGGFCFIDQEHPSIQIASYYNLQFAISTDGGANFTNHLISNSRGQFINPADYDNLNKVLYAGDDAGTYFRWTNPQNAGSTPDQISVSAFNSAKITFVKLSPNVTNRVYFGLSNGAVVQVDDAHTGTTKTGVVIRPDLGASVFLSCIDVEKGNENHMLISYSNYGMVSVYESSPGTGGSLNWNAVDVHSSSYSLPDMPIRWCMFDPRNTDWAILATEMGVWSTADLNGTSTVWQPSNNTIANTRVDMLRYRSSDRLLLAATHGRGLFSTTIPAGAPLPLTLADFKGTNTGHEIALEWKTVSENNSKEFEIEKSISGSGFKKIGVVRAAGTSQSTKNYAFGDKDISQRNNFYRLKLVDNTGSFEYSHIILVANRLHYDKNILILTNPFSEYIDVAFSEIDKGKALFKLYDFAGRKLLQKSYDVDRGMRLRLPLESIQMGSGIYTLECVMNKKRHVRQLLKQ